MTSFPDRDCDANTAKIERGPLEDPLDGSGRPIGEFEKVYPCIPKPILFELSWC